MKHFFAKLFNFYGVVKNKIAFYPTLISLVGFFLALGMIIWEEAGVSRQIIEIFPMLMVDDGNTALNVLSTCIGGLISMMVFSFSMVMLLLSQASSNFSPRLLPGLISDKKHQIILGLFLATIIYNIFTLFSIETSEEKYTLPGFSVLLGVIFTILCLSAFIFFIHNISQSIQINNIMDSIYKDAVDRLRHMIDAEVDYKSFKADFFPDTSNWHSYTTPTSGYFQNIAIANVTEICSKHDVRIYIMIPKGLFVLGNATLLKSEKPLDKDVLDKIFDNINFARGEYIRDNYVLAFKQITEIAVKAMSPGINDPGTALNAIDYLTELFSLKMKKINSGVITFNKETRIKIAIIKFDELIYNVMASLRTYCKHDPIVVQKLFWMLNYLQKQPTVDESYTKSIAEQIDILMDVIDLDSKKDIQKLKETIEKSKLD